MSFFDWLEEKIRAAYLKLLETNHPSQIRGKTLNCDSFRKIANDVKIFINEAQTKGYTTVFQITNYIIISILNTNYFVYENNKMAIFIGHLYLQNRGVDHIFKVGNISNSSTFEEIDKITSSWVGINGT
jgi:prophage maintenance system killer protein